MSTAAGDGGFGPFDTEMPVGLTEYGGGAGLVEGSPTSQSVGAGGEAHLLDPDATVTVDEKLGVVVRTGPLMDETEVDPVTGLKPTDVRA